MTQTLRDLALPCALAAGWTLMALPALADDGRRQAAVVQAKMNSYEEVPSVSSTGNGTFKARIDKATGEVDYDFSYEEMQGTVLQAHIHFGQQGVNGGISVWLCQSAVNPAPAAVAAITASLSGLTRMRPWPKAEEARSTSESFTGTSPSKASMPRS